MTPPILSFGTTQKVISRNVERLMRTHAFDNNPKRAQAIAYKQAGRSGRRPRRRS